ncbi:glutaminase kidney isoform, mitochondrial isoform X3 [Myotis daubentonii]|uniref:glutaminase kidney isoform, mitochondrial isoform X3 n=1 Tax=Myotis daubentonii TaxID=98922 RepID=UPI002872CA91|nr:glutaminase kidney isoform, mitochondrial isoform X3 [Myotis daubentonii]
MMRLRGSALLRDLLRPPAAASAALRRAQPLATLRRRTRGGGPEAAGPAAAARLCPRWGGGGRLAGPGARGLSSSTSEILRELGKAGAQQPQEPQPPEPQPGASPPAAPPAPGAKDGPADTDAFGHSEGKELAASGESKIKQGLLPSLEDLLFYTIAEGQEKIPVHKFITALKSTGLRTSDPRLKECMDMLRLTLQTTSDGVMLDKDLFKKCVQSNIVLLTQAFRRKFVIPDFMSFTSHIDELYESAKKQSGGKVADYIPQLAKFSPDLWGVSVCTVDGQRHSIGDTKVPFCLQSCVKPLKYAIAVNDLGTEYVHRYVGKEPSGLRFNKLFLNEDDKPHNPMVNAGAIVVTSLIKQGVNNAEKFDYVMQFLNKMAGNEYVGFSNATFQSERESGDRNFAIGYYLKEKKCFPEGTDMVGILDFYFQVGLPAKSGVAGGILLVVPNVMGMMCWSPPLDKMGNSVKGIHFCHDLVSLCNFHNYDNLRHFAKKLDPRREGGDQRVKSVINLLFAAYTGDVSALRRFALSAMDMEQRDYDSRTALHVAAAEGHVEVVKFLLEACKVNPFPKDRAELARPFPAPEPGGASCPFPLLPARWNNTPMDEALHFGHHDVFKILQEYQGQYTPQGDADDGKESQTVHKNLDGLL